MNTNYADLMERGEMGTFMFQDVTGTITLCCEKQGDHPPAVRLKHATGGYTYLLHEKKMYWYVPLAEFLKGEQKLHGTIKGQHAIYVSGIIHHAHMIYRKKRIKDREKRMRTRR